MIVNYCWSSTYYIIILDYNYSNKEINYALIKTQWHDQIDLIWLLHSKGSHYDYNLIKNKLMNFYYSILVKLMNVSLLHQMFQ
jgi:hypothetical protein